MAKRKKSYAEKVARVRERWKVMEEHDRENRELAVDDLKFINIPGEQWDAQAKKARGNRPCYEFNKLRVTIKRVVNDMRANRPAVKIRATEDSDKPTAETLEGMIRNIWNCSDGDTVFDAAAEYQVGGGMCVWRVNVKYNSDDVFEQDIVIEPFRNQLMVYCDPSAQDPMKRDADDWMIVSRMKKSKFEERWPDAEDADFEIDTQFDDDEDWEDEEKEEVRIAEYWYKEPVKKTLYQWDDGKVTDSADKESDKAQVLSGSVIVKSRVVNSHRIRMCIASGKAILEEAEWAGSQFPFVMVYGESIVIDGKHHWFGQTRHSRGSQVAYNYARTSAIEAVALAPKAKFWATAEQARGHTKQWIEAHDKNYPYMLYNSDPKEPGAPKQMPPPDVPAALEQQILIASEDIKGTTGVFDASLGRQSNETAGIAIQRRQEQGEIVTFNFRDNMAKGMQRTGEILVDLIPKIYDTQRSVRILGADLSEKFVLVNEAVVDPATGNTIKVNDLSKGKYDVAVTVGPSFTTRRQEAADIYLQLANKSEGIFQLAGDLIFKSLDVPYAEEIAERMKLMLPPAIQKAEAEGKEIPPEVSQMMAQAEQAMQQVQQMASAIQAEAAKVENDKAGLTKQAAELNVKFADMKSYFAEQSAALTKQEAQLIVKQAQSQASDGQQNVEAERQAFNDQALKALGEMQSQVASWITDASKVIAEIMKAGQQPRSKVIEASRVNGKLVVNVQESA